MFGAKGLIKANMKTYFKAKAKGKSVDEAIDLVIQTRYPMSSTNREEIREICNDEIPSSWEEEEKLKELVLQILFFEYPRAEDKYYTGSLSVSRYSDAGLNPFAKKIYNLLDSTYNSMKQKYGV